MSYRLLHDALHATGIKGNTKLVLIALADFANDATGECYPSQTTLSRVLECDRTTIVEALNRLEKIGYIKRGTKHGLSLNYVLTIPHADSHLCAKTEHNDLCGKIQHNDLCGKIQHNDLCGKIQQVEEKEVSNNSTGMFQNPTGVWENPTGVWENPTGGVGKSNTNREYNREDNREYNREENKQHNKASNSNIISHKANISNAAAADAEILTPRIIKADATAKLVAEGMTEETAKAKIADVWEQFEAEAKSMPRDTLRNPRNYFAAKLAGMAKDGKKEVSADPYNLHGQAEPRDLVGILGVLTGYYQRRYPEQAKMLSGVLDYHDLQYKISYIWNDLASLEVLDWNGEQSPCTIVKRRMDNYVSREVAKAITSQHQSLQAKVRSLKHDLAVARDTIEEIEKARTENGKDPTPPKEHIRYWNAKKALAEVPAKLAEVEARLADVESKNNVAAA